MRKQFFLVVYFIGYLALIGCGVRGDPLPPTQPAELGRGRPNYKRATEGMKLQDPHDNDAGADDEEEEKKNSDEEVF